MKGHRTALTFLSWYANFELRSPHLFRSRPPCFLCQELTFLEFFAGEGEVWRAMRADSIASIGVDINYFQRQPGEQNPMDILSDAGFGCGTE